MPIASGAPAANPADRLSFRIVIPTYNAASWIEAQTRGLLAAGVVPTQVLVIDSSSRDDTRQRYASWGAEVVKIAQSEFNHGGTRQWAAEYCDSEFLVYLTQDAIPADTETFKNILRVFNDPRVAIAYGRQLPRPGAKAIEAHARLFNYPAASSVLTLADKAAFGSKLIFSSDSFAAYRRQSLLAVGGFPKDVFFAEDQIAAARLLKAGFAKAYVADACVHHSHSYSMSEDFRRYFDVGVFHAMNSWLTEEFGRSEGEGFRFVKSELKHLARHAPFMIPAALVRTFVKYAGYRLGKLERFFSPGIKRKLSASPYYWLSP